MPHTTRRATVMDRLRMRTKLLIPLLILSFGWTVLSLLIVRTIVQRQIRADLTSDLQHSVNTYQNLRRQRHDLLLRESALLAELPTLKALMTAHDKRTIQDAGADYWRISGSDFFALLAQDGNLIAAFAHDPAVQKDALQQQLNPPVQQPAIPVQQLIDPLQQPSRTSLIALNNRLYEVSARPIFFGDRQTGSPLGYVAVGYAIDERVAREVSEAAAAEVAFAANGLIVASTLSQPRQQQLATFMGTTLQPSSPNTSIRIGDEHYLAATAPLEPQALHAGSTTPPSLIVLKSIDHSMLLLYRVNRWVLLLAICAFLVGVLVIVSISRTITHPLAVLVDGTRALGKGNFDYQLSEEGAEEVRELSRAFERMRIELKRSQKDLLDSERQATIGRMASSISHDLRHYLSAMYANAEFMCDARLPDTEREELFKEVQTAIHGMTDLLDSLLLFTQTGRALHPEYESIGLLLQRSVSLVRTHPSARDVTITIDGLSSLEVWVDALKLGRAVNNIVLNGCQAARRGAGRPSVQISLQEKQHALHISVSDSGPGVPEHLQPTMFQAFVSEGKESGVGLGLTLAQQIAQEHGGNISYGTTAEGATLFTMVLPLTQPQTGPAPSKTSTLPKTKPVVNLS